MVNSKTIKFYTSTNLNAPQLLNSSGSLLTLLDSCLVNGLSLPPVASLTAAGLKATITFTVAHNLMKHQIVSVSGANQPEFNGDFKISSIVSDLIVEYSISAIPSNSVVTSAVTCTLTPLNFEKTFSKATPLGGGRAAFRSKDISLSNRPFLRIIDERVSSYNNTYAKYAKVGIVENMTDIDTMSGVQAPYLSSAASRNWTLTGSGATVKNGWAKWYYYTYGENYSDATDLSTFDNVSGPWFIIGNGSSFYLLTTVSNDIYLPTEDQKRSFFYGFGSFETIADDDLFTHFLLATNIWESAESISYRAESYTSSVVVGSSDSSYIAPGRSVFLQRGYKKSAHAIATCSKVSLNYSSTVSGGLDQYTADPSTIGGVVLQTPLIFELTSTSKFLPRGFLPIVKTIPHQALFLDLQIIEQTSRVFLAKKVYGTSGLPDGVVLFDLGETSGY